MKFIFALLVILSTSLKAEVSRSPAIVTSLCELDIPTTRADETSKKNFVDTFSHKVLIHPDDIINCSTLPKKRLDDSLYILSARNEAQLLFKKYSNDYSKKCSQYYKLLGLKEEEFVCAEPEIITMTPVKYECEKQTEEGTGKINYVSIAEVEIKYKQTGKRMIEKSAADLQKEQCHKAKECISNASEKNLPELKKLASVACKVEISPVGGTRAPALIHDSSFDGSRRPKIETDKDDKQNILEKSGTMIK